MKKIVLCAIAILLILCGCKQQSAKPTDPTESQAPTQTTAAPQLSEATTPNASSNPTETTKPNEIIKPTETTKPTETNAPTETTAPTVTAPKELTVADWQLEKPEYLTYEEYFSEERSMGGSPNTWIKGDKTFTFLCGDNSEYKDLIICSRSGNDPVIFTVPGGEAYADYYIAGADGRVGYLYNTNQLLRLDLATGKADILLEGQNFCNPPFLCDNLVVYYASYAAEELTIGRIYLPTLKKDILYTGQGVYYDLAFLRPQINNAPVSWCLMNPELVTRLQEELRNPDSKYGLDYVSADWNEVNLTLMLREPKLLQHIQDDSGIPALLKCTYDFVDGKMTYQTGIIDGCFYGSAYLHDHYNTEITTAPEPEVLMGEWIGLSAKAAELLNREKDAAPKADGKLIVMAGVDSFSYMFAKTEGDYKKILNDPVAWAIDTGTCVMYASVDKQKVFAVSYDGTQNTEILRATRGGLEDVDTGYGLNMVLLRDGDTLLEIDLVDGCYRYLVRHQYIKDFNCDIGYVDGKLVDAHKVYFEVREGLYAEGYTLDMDTGEIKKGYRF